MEPGVLRSLVMFILVVGAVLGTRYGWPNLLRGLKNPAHPDSILWLVRGIRDVIISLSCLCLFYGVVEKSTASLMFGAIFLVEELYETGLVLLILKYARPKPHLAT